MAQKKYDLHGMIVTVDEDQQAQRRHRIEVLLEQANAVVAEIQTAKAAASLEANALKVAADTRVHEVLKKEASRERGVKNRLSHIDECRGRISDLQKQITLCEQELGDLRGPRAQAIEAEREEALAACREAEKAAALVDRRYRKKLREAENEAERYRMKLVRLDLRTATPATAPEVAVLPADTVSDAVREHLLRPSPPPEVLHVADDRGGEDFPEIEDVTS